MDNCHNMEKELSEELNEGAGYDPGNLGTIQEAEEFGYQSDNDNTVYLPPGTLKRKVEREDDVVTRMKTYLPTLSEESS